MRRGLDSGDGMGAPDSCGSFALLAAAFFAGWAVIDGDGPNCGTA